jgi:hypothetical protein
MADRHRLYRALVRLYPRQFRRDYGDDLVQHFADLVTDRGARAAWRRTSLDLTITIPRYHLERIMNDQRSTVALIIIIILLAVGGIASFFVLGDAWFSPLLLVAAGALALTQHSALAKALRVPDTNRRHRRLKTAAFLAPVFPALWFTFDWWVGDSWSIRATLLTIVGLLSLVGAIGYLIAGLATPRTPDHGQLTGSA